MHQKDQTFPEASIFICILTLGNKSLCNFQRKRSVNLKWKEKESSSKQLVV